MIDYKDIKIEYIALLSIFIFVLYIQYMIDKKYKCNTKTLIDKLKLPLIFVIIIIIINNYYKNNSNIDIDLNSCLVKS